MRGCASRTSLAGALLALSWSQAAGAGPLCAETPATPLLQPIAARLGCQLIDCCPGCPGGPIDLRIRISGAPVHGAEIRILPPEGRPRTQRVPPGETILRGVARSDAPGPAPVAELRLEVGELTAGPITVELTQLLGPVTVNDLHGQWHVTPCPDPPPCDRVAESGKSGADRTVAMLDGRRAAGSAGCANDEVLRLGPGGPVGSVLADAGCRSEIALFSSGNAMFFEEAVAGWKDPCGDTHAAALTPLLVAPATFYLAIPDPLAQLQWGKTDAQVALLDLDQANDVYDLNKTGISVSMTKRALTFAEGVELLGLLPGALLHALKGPLNPFSFVCNVTQSLENEGYYVPGRLNVYYLPVPGRGMTCPDNRNIVFIALDRKPETLAHELGHSFSLLGEWGHTNDVPGFDSTNVMWGGSQDVRTHFSLGQAFRLNVAGDSTLNTNQVRQGVERSCPMTLDSDACPLLRLDWVRP